MNFGNFRRNATTNELNEGLMFSDDFEDTELQNDSIC